MKSSRQPKRPFEKVYSSIPHDIKEALQDEADRRGLQLSDVIREALMEKYVDRRQTSQTH